MKTMNDISHRDQIRIHNLEVFCNHGVYREETVLGQKFTVDAALYTSTRKAGLSDELEDSVSYGEVCRFILNEMKKQNDRLLEKVAERLAEGILLHFPAIFGVSLEVKKPWAPVMMHIDYASVYVERCWHRVYVGAGSNLGDRRRFLSEAVSALEKLPLVRHVKTASVIETAPYGYTNQGNFLNTVIYLETLYEPGELLDALHKLEAAAGRERTIHWGPRTLDLDILLYDDLISEDRELVIPHPEMEKRLFVMEPLCELLPYGVHPVSRRRFTEIRESLKSDQKRDGDQRE